MPQCLPVRLHHQQTPLYLLISTTHSHQGSWPQTPASQTVSQSPYATLMARKLPSGLYKQTVSELWENVRIPIGHMNWQCIIHYAESHVVLVIPYQYLYQPIPQMVISANLVSYPLTNVQQPPVRDCVSVYRPPYHCVDCVSSSWPAGWLSGCSQGGDDEAARSLTTTTQPLASATWLTHDSENRSTCCEKQFQMHFQKKTMSTIWYLYPKDHSSVGGSIILNLTLYWSAMNFFLNLLSHTIWCHLVKRCLLNITDGLRNCIENRCIFAVITVASDGLAPLTHWGRDKMAAVSQTTLSNAFSFMKMSEFRLRFHWSLFLRVQLTIIQDWFR